MKRIIINRTDNIGDVVLTLPMAGLIKKLLPESKIIFLGKRYTSLVIALSKYVDEFVDWDEIAGMEEEEKIKKIKALEADCIIHVFPNIGVASLAKKAGIPLRVGTSRKFYHLLTCNSFVNLKRKNTELHEAQLNFKLLRFLRAKDDYSLNEISELYGFDKIKEYNTSVFSTLEPNKFNLIIHPKSKGSAREWGCDNFLKLSEMLPAEKFNLFITGTKEEKEIINKELISKTNRFIDLSGKMDLSELIAFISKSDGLLAASTGPLHIAAALGKNALGLYAPMRPIFPTRWAPVGKNAHYFVVNKSCSACRKNNRCSCIVEISPMDVALKMNQLYEQKFKLG